MSSSVRQPKSMESKDSHAEVSLCINNSQATKLLEAKVMRWAKWNIESYDARSIPLKVVPSHSEIIIVWANVGCLPVCKQEEFLFSLCGERQ